MRRVSAKTDTQVHHDKRLAAQEAARRVAGVRDVENGIAVKTPGGLFRTDTEIAQAVRRTRRAERHARQTRVDVRDGIATLTGSVRSWAERRSVLGAARSTPGIRIVEDRLWPEELRIGP
jgi:osmotically-inducible protein OsmY